MLFLLEPTMGCGRSKHSSKNSSEDSERDSSKQAQKLLTKTDKSNKIGDKKENEDPNIRTTVVKNGGSSKRERATRKQEEKLTLSPLKSANKNYVNNGTVNVATNKEVVQDSAKSEKFLEAKVRTTFKDRPVPGNAQNVQNLTSSQIEFFKMLDEKIEQGCVERHRKSLEIYIQQTQGRDYTPEESSED